MSYVADAYHPKEPATQNMDSIQLKRKELQSKMYLTETHRLKTHWIHKIGNRQ